MVKCFRLLNVSLLVGCAALFADAQTMVRYIEGNALPRSWGTVSTNRQCCQAILLNPNTRVVYEVGTPNSSDIGQLRLSVIDLTQNIETQVVNLGAGQVHTAAINTHTNKIYLSGDYLGLPGGYSDNQNILVIDGSTLAVSVVTRPFRSLEHLAVDEASNRVYWFVDDNSGNKRPSGERLTPIGRVLSFWRISQVPAAREIRVRFLSTETIIYDCPAQSGLAPEHPVHV